MFAKSLEIALARICAGSDVSPVESDGMAQRMERLRGVALLPRGRENRAARLTPRQIAAAVLGLASVTPAWAGHAAVVLARFRAVGGACPFGGDGTLLGCVERLIEDKDARDRMVGLSLSMAEHARQMHGGAVLTWNAPDGPRAQGFVSSLAISLLQPGAEGRFDPEAWRSPARRALVLSRRFFEELARARAASLRMPEPPGDGSEYDTEEARQARLRALGVRPGSRYLNIGVETHATWPMAETVICFEGKRLILMPRTADASASVHIDLQSERVTTEQAMTLINRFLSLLSWQDDASAIARGGWSGNPEPVVVPRRDLAQSVARDWWLRSDLPQSDAARRAIGYYREGRNAEEAELVSFAVLSYLKAIEVRFGDDSKKVKRWIREAYPELLRLMEKDDPLARFEAERGEDPPEEHIWIACRVAVAHASVKRPSDPDDMTELRRLSRAADVLRLLARRMIDELSAVDAEPIENGQAP